MDAPEWLKSRRGELQRCPDALSYAVVFDGKPLYMVKAIPADGRHACEVMQSNNGKRLDIVVTYPSSEDALRGGLEDLRKALGW